MEAAARLGFPRWNGSISINRVNGGFIIRPDCMHTNDHIAIVEAQEITPRTWKKIMAKVSEMYEKHERANTYAKMEEANHRAFNGLQRECEKNIFDEPKDEWLPGRISATCTEVPQPSETH